MAIANNGNVARIRAVLALALALVGAALMASGCTEPGGEGPGHRRQSLALTPQQELALGRQAYQEILTKARGHVLPPDDERVRRVRRIGERIAKAARIEPLDREINLHFDPRYLEWEYNVIESNQVNAFCLPGGKVVVYTGLLPVAQNDDQLATVMSHEIAHALAHHASERIAREQMYQTAVSAAGGTLGGLDHSDRQKLIGLLGAGASGLFGKAHDRQQEAEADHIGLFLMTFAGYDPDQALAFWERMQQISARQGRPPEILSDHPSDAHRIAMIKQWIPQAKAALRAYNQGWISPAKRQ
jgi:metalloendopeptidase OMA1, mitochondrial